MLLYLIDEFAEFLETGGHDSLVVSLIRADSLELEVDETLREGLLRGRQLCNAQFDYSSIYHLVAPALCSRIPISLRDKS